MPPKVFISYSHDSPGHEAAVLDLSNRLRSQGIDAVLDQYENFPAEGWIQWMKRQIRDSQFILVVCTETYRRRADGEEKAGVGLGALYESGLIQQLLYDGVGLNKRVVPVLLDAANKEHIPLELRRYTHYCADIDSGYVALYSLLMNQPTIDKPPLGFALPPKEAKPDFRNLVWNLPPRNPFFTGRTPHLELIHKALTEKTTLTQPHAISGLGGIGKTQSAIEYAHRYRADFVAVLWCVADSRDALLSGFATFASLLNLFQHEERDFNIVAASVYRWLELNRGWLLILDDVEDLALVREFVPIHADGHVLVTTRLHATGEFAEPIDLKKMDSEEGALLLLRRARIIPKDQTLDAACEGDRAVAMQISAEMDGLPLALDQAGAFIEEVPSALAEYLLLYRAFGAKLRARRGKESADHSSATVTFSLAFSRVVGANPAAADLVRACAFLAPDTIPEEIFTQSKSAWGGKIAELCTKPLAWIGALEEAGRFALIRRDAKDKSLHMHRIVQEVVKDEMTLEARSYWAERAVKALNNTLPVAEFPNWPQWERLLSHARIAVHLIEHFGLVSRVAARLLNLTGNYLDDRAQYGEAEVLYRRALEIYEKASGPEDRNIATTCNNLAALYFATGRYADAEALYSRALTISEKALGPEHPETAATLNNVATFYSKRGRYAQAETLFRRALAIREKAVAPSQPGIATILNNLAELYRNQGRYTQAEPLYLRALSICESSFGSEHPYTAATLNNLALLYVGQHRHDDAEPFYRRALAIVEKTLGPEHPTTATNLTNLALLYENQQRYDDAEPLYRRAIVIREKALGFNHPDTVFNIRRHVVLLRKFGRGDEAQMLESRLRAIGG